MARVALALALALAALESAAPQAAWAQSSAAPEETTPPSSATQPASTTEPSAATTTATPPSTDAPAASPETTAPENTTPETTTDVLSGKKIPVEREEAATLPAFDPNQAAPAPTPPTTTSAPDTTSAVKEGEGPLPPRMFGSWLIHLGVAQPTITDLPLYETLYGSKTKILSHFATEYYPFNIPYANLGFGFRAGYYKATGDGAVTDTNNKVIEPVTTAENGPTSLTFVPLSFTGHIQMSPFKRKWLALQGWAGYELTYCQEIRDPVTESSTNAEEGLYANKSRADAIVFGGSVRLLLNALDEQSVNSMNDTMGLGSVYLSPFIEIVKARDTSAMNFARTSLGVAFSFESLQ